MGINWPNIRTGVGLLLGSVVFWILGGLEQVAGAQWLGWGIWPAYWLLVSLPGLAGFSLLAAEGIVAVHSLLQRLRAHWSNRPVPDVVGVMLGAASGAFMGWHFALRTAFVCAESGRGTAPLLGALFSTGAAAWLGIVWITAARNTAMAASMPGFLVASGGADWDRSSVAGPARCSRITPSLHPPSRW